MYENFSKQLKDRLFSFKEGLLYKVFSVPDHTFVYDGNLLYELIFANHEFHLRRIHQCKFPQIDEALEACNVELKAPQVCWLPY